MKFESLPQGVRLAVEAAQEKKAAGITVLDLTAAGAFTEYFVVCTGFSTPQVQAICTEVEAQLHKNLKRSPEHREGHRSANGRCSISAALSYMFSASKRAAITISSACGGMLPNSIFPTSLTVLPPIETCLSRTSGTNTFPAKPLPADRKAAVRSNDRGTIAVDHRRSRIAPSL